MESPPSRVRVGVEMFAPIATLSAAFLLAFRRIDDFDTWWHLATGRWIVAHGTIPATDVLSHTVRGHPWINLEWAYEVALYLLYAAGGPLLLCLAAAAGFTSAVWLLLRLVRPHLGVAGGSILILAVILVMQDRFAIRPEMISFPLLAGVLSIIDHAGRREGRRLWLLVPLMLVWVNVHALFVVGAFAILCAILGTPSLKLTTWGLAAIASVIVNPFGWHGVLLPAKLFTLIKKESPEFQTIAEFRSPFESDVGGVAMWTYKVLLIAGILFVLAGFAIDLRKRRADLGGIALFAGLAVLSAVARRNAALFALGGAPLIARSVGTVVSTLPAKLRAALLRVAPSGAVVVICIAVALGASVVTGAFYRWDSQPREFGAGVLEGLFPIRAAAFAREAKLPSKLYNDVAAGGYLAWDDPIGDGVFIDGRLEVYDTRFFSDYVLAMYDQERWESDADRFGIQTVILFHRWENRRLLVERLVHGGIWSLVYADEVAAVFVRARGNEEVLKRAAAMNDRWNRATREWLARPIPKWRYPAGRVAGTRSFARLLATIGDADGAAETYATLLALGVSTDEEIDLRLRIAKHFAETGRIERARQELNRILEIDPGNAEARNLLR